MNIAQIETNISKLVKKIKPESFIYDLLLAYGLPKASITRLQQGNLDLSKVPGEVSWKKKVLFKEEFMFDLHESMGILLKGAKYNQRFVITTDFKKLLAVDTKTNDKLDTSITELHKHFDFFLPWAGMEKSQHHGENPADVKAAEKMAKLFDEIKRDNPNNSPEFVHNLNVFLSRLLFCFFAEDTNIFEKGLFINAISSHTQADGSDLGAYLDKLFTVLNTPKKERENLPAFLNAFPYVNGGLFKLKLQPPKFTRRSRQAVIDCGDMDWSAINPDIFGSMMQAVVTPENRGGLGMHYTSVPNIMKVIKPLFLDDLYEEFEKAKGNQKKLNALLERIYKIKIFDPACGSGNFLIIAYKELRKLEMAIFKAGNTMLMSRVSLAQFYGIEIDDFAHELAQLSLWLTEHQLNVEFYKSFGKTNPTLPLKEAGKIVCGNACRVGWEDVCPKCKDDEIYVLGNPPYLGYSVQSSNQKEDMSIAFCGHDNYKNLDYIACWFINAADYVITKKQMFAFVTTDSICKGEQVASLWPKILSKDLEIIFAYKTFKWTNNAKSNAGVACTIIGVRKKNIELKQKKILFRGNLKIHVGNINPYLADANNIIIQKRSVPFGKLQTMSRGSGAVDDGHLILNETEMLNLVNKYPYAFNFFKTYIGADEFLYNFKRYCLWLNENTTQDACKINELRLRIENVGKFRLKSKKNATFEMAKFPYLFGECRYQNSSSIIIPRVSSEKREYIPIGFTDKNIVISDSAQAIYNAELFLFGIITSRIHMVWIFFSCGSLESRIRYSPTLGYNTFPFPEISLSQKKELEKFSCGIISERERHPEKTLAELYDPDKMPSGLREAHRQNDIAVERCYRSKPFTTDEERLEYLFNLYEQMIAEEKNKGTLFESQLKPKRGKK